jgi:hypothetical protein
LALAAVAYLLFFRSPSATSNGLTTLDGTPLKEISDPELGSRFHIAIQNKLTR